MFTTLEEIYEICERRLQIDRDRIRFLRIGKWVHVSIDNGPPVCGNKVKEGACKFSVISQIRTACLCRHCMEMCGAILQNMNMQDDIRQVTIYDMLNQHHE